MQGWLWVCLLLGLGNPPQREVTYGFATRDYVIEMTVTFLKPYAGQRLTFYSSAASQREVCDWGPLGECPQRFVGAVALVQYSVRLWNGKPPNRVTIREHVTVMQQSQDLPDRPPFSKTQALTNGRANDIQALGYDETEVRKSDRTTARRQARQRSWRAYRQELYMEPEARPFAIVEWKHTIDRISILRIYSPAP